MEYCPKINPKEIGTKVYIVNVTESSSIFHAVKINAREMFMADIPPNPIDGPCPCNVVASTRDNIPSFLIHVKRGLKSQKMFKQILSYLIFDIPTRLKKRTRLKVRTTMIIVPIQIMFHIGGRGSPSKLSMAKPICSGMLTVK